MKRIFLQLSLLLALAFSWSAQTTAQTIVQKVTKDCSAGCTSTTFNFPATVAGNSLVIGLKADQISPVFSVACGIVPLDLYTTATRTSNLGIAGQLFEGIYLSDTYGNVKTIGMATPSPSETSCTLTATTAWHGAAIFWEISGVQGAGINTACYNSGTCASTATSVVSTTQTAAYAEPSPGSLLLGILSGFPNTPSVTGSVSTTEFNSTANGAIFTSATTTASAGRASLAGYSIASGVATITTATQPFVAGQLVTIRNAYPNQNFNGKWTLTSATPTSITFAIAQADSSGTETDGQATSAYALTGTWASGTSSPTIVIVSLEPRVLVAPVPVLNLPTGNYHTAQLTMTSMVVGGPIYYNTTGSPACGSATLYSGPISVASTTTYYAVSCPAGYTSSSAVSSTITVIGGSPQPWFIRSDGGTRYSANVAGQCDGKSDAAYPGSGVNRPCAFNQVRYLWNDGTTGDWGWVIAGGDTVDIEGCSAPAGQLNPDYPHCRIGFDDNIGNSLSNPWCWYAPGAYGSNTGCYNPPIPAGTSSAHTRILGLCGYQGNCTPLTVYPYTGNNLTQIFSGFGDQFALNMVGAQYVDVVGLEITSHNGKCSQYGNPSFPKFCNNNLGGADDYGNNGILVNNTTGNVLLRDVSIHGFTASGLSGPIGGSVTMTRVFVGFNGFSAWNFDDGNDTPNAPGSSIVGSYVIMIGNGCVEEYPITHLYPGMVCYDTNNGGFGDSWSGQDTALDSFTCDYCQNLYNTKDGWIGPHTWITTLSITNSVSIGNMGADWKWGAAIAPNTTVFTNNLTVGNCQRMSQPMAGWPTTYNQYLSNWCRAGGNIVASTIPSGSVWTIADNTWITYEPTTLLISCTPGLESCPSTVNLTNNIFLGYVNPNSVYGAATPALYYFQGYGINVAGASHNISFGMRNGACPSASGTDLCVSPLFVGQPGQTWVAESQLDNFNYHLAAGSPAIGYGVPVSSVTTDYAGNTRLTPTSAGAYEYIIEAIQSIGSFFTGLMRGVSK